MSGSDLQNTFRLCLAVWDLGLCIYLSNKFLFDHALFSHQTTHACKIPQILWFASCWINRSSCVCCSYLITPFFFRENLLYFSGRIRFSHFETPVFTEILAFKRFCFLINILNVSYSKLYCNKFPYF